MLSSDIYYKIISIDGDKIVDVNGYDYIRVKALIPKGIEIYMLFSIKTLDMLKEETCYYSEKAYLTSLVKEKKISKEFGFRIDVITKEIDINCFNSLNESDTKFNAKIIKKDFNVIKNLGPMNIPTCSVKAIIKNELNSYFSVLVVGFHSKAKMLSDLSDICYVDIIGSISGPRNQGMPHAIIVKDIILQKEVS
jgi:hypothetical protein